MNILAKLLATNIVVNWIINCVPKTHYSDIRGDNGSLYMCRWWLFNPYDAQGNRKYQWCPWSVRLHFIRRPDRDRDLHDHPWNARTFILSGWYDEEREWEPDAWQEIYTPPDYITREVYRRKAGDTYKIKFGEFHRISRVCGHGCFTLFITGPKRGEWGFLRQGVKVLFRDGK